MTPEARTARERKQKIFVVVGGLVLVVLLAIQLPRLLGGSSSSTAAPATQTTPAGIPPVPTPAPTTGRAVVAPARQTAPALSSVSGFAPKDPFVQQVVTDRPAAAPAGGGTGKASEKPAAEKFSVGSKRTSAAKATVVTVNGVRQVLETGDKFPASDPVFVLVAEKPATKSVAVGVAGGAYAGGASTTTLKVGKPLTLVNTATGARYRLALVSVGSGESATQPPDKK